MPDAFFATKSRKRKRSAPQDRSSGKHSKTANGTAPTRAKGKNAASTGASNKQRRKPADEELSDETQDEGDFGGIEEMDLRAPDADAYESGEEFDDETPAEKRLRLAKLYLKGVKENLGLAEGEFDAAEIDRDLISSRLKQDVMEHSGKVYLYVADNYDFINPPTLRTRGHRFSVTSAVASEDGRWLFSASKDGSIIKWDLHTGAKLHTFHKCRPAKDKGKGKQKADGEVQGHTDEVWTLALSVDGKHLASGGKDRRVGVWDAVKDEWIKGFGGHRDCISSLTFRRVAPTASTSTQLYSGSFDRTIKLFDLASMGYVETLFGHQAPVICMDALRNETAVSVGGRDKTVRFWKIPEESQLVFRGGGGSKWVDDLDGLDMEVDEEDDGNNDITTKVRKHTGKGKGKTQEKFIEGSIDSVVMIDESTFVSGGDSGSISLWTTQKKKPIFTQALAHGLDESHVDTEDVDIVRKPRWVTALGSLRYSDLFASGSWDGEIRLWKLNQKLKSFALIGTISVPGVINSLQFVSPPSGALDAAPWTSSPDHHSSTAKSTKSIAQKTVLLVAGVGQEMRFGRWVQKKGDGVFNGTRIFALHPRTAAQTQQS